MKNHDYLPLGPLQHLELRRNRTLETYIHQNIGRDKEILDDGALHSSKLNIIIPENVEGTEKEVGRFQEANTAVEVINIAIRNVDVVRGMDDVSSRTEESWTDTIVFIKQKMKVQVKEVVTSVHEEELLKKVQSDEIKGTGVTDAEEEKEENKKKEERKIRRLAKNGLDDCSPQMCNKKRKYGTQTDLDYGLGEVEKEMENDVIYWERICKGKFMSENR